MNSTPSLFGIKNSNKDFSSQKNWGKNLFNNAFPVSLLVYMHSRGIEPVYITLGSDLNTVHSKISVSELFGIDPESDDIRYEFEIVYSPYKKFVEGELPRIDLVTMDNKSQRCLSGLEIKLTALPDDTTHRLSGDEYSSEIVVRPDTIVYLGISIARRYEENPEELLNVLRPICEKITDWSSIKDVLPNLPKMLTALNSVLQKQLHQQQPLIVQPIWKTEGKAPVLSEHCLDAFVWSDYAFTRLFVDAVTTSQEKGGMDRHKRTFIWLVKMLFDFANNGKINHKRIIDAQSYNTKNDKAFALSGKKTYKYLKSDELTAPRVKRSEIKNIILGDGHKWLSPERRLDATIIANERNLFNS